MSRGKLYTNEEFQIMRNVVSLGKNLEDSCKYIKENNLLPNRSYYSLRVTMCRKFKEELSNNRKNNKNLFKEALIKELNTHPYNMQKAFEIIGKQFNMSAGSISVMWYTKLKKECTNNKNTPLGVAGNTVYANTKNVMRGKEDKVLPFHNLRINGFVLNSATSTYSPDFSF